MPQVLYDDFLKMKKGDEITLHYQEVNPPDRTQVQLHEIHWTHDRVDGDLIFGSMNIPGIGTLGVDAYAYRNYGSEYAPNVLDIVSLSSVNIKRALDDAEQHNLSGWSLHTEPLLPSEIYTPANPHKRQRTNKIPNKICFSRDEHAAILTWQRAIEEKGFNSDFSREGYASYKQGRPHHFYSRIESGGLIGDLQITRMRKGLFSSFYEIYAGDDSYRRSNSNPMLKHTEPSSTRLMREERDSFSELLKLMDQFVDMLVKRNRRHIDNSITTTSY